MMTNGTPRIQAETEVVAKAMRRRFSGGHEQRVPEIARMRTGATLVNLGRGDMVDETALHAALLSGRPFGAGPDVYPQEPYNGPLCDQDNVILSPYSATLTVETRSAMEREAVGVAPRFLEQKLPMSERVA